MMIRRNNENDIDVLAVASILLGLQNLQENREQTAHNDVQLANDKQAEYLLNEINKQFEKQNEILDRISKLLEKID